MSNKKNHFIGVHVSISGGFSKAIAEGTEIGCTAIQIFTKSNRQWRSKAISKKEALEFIEVQKKSNIKLVVSHASYLINLGSSTPDVQKKSFLALIDEIKRCNQLEIPYLVLHPGTSQPDQKEETLRQTGDYINQAILATSDCSTTVLIETMAGQGKSIGRSFQELAIMLSQIADKKRIGVCFDTCHVFAAGYDLRSQEGYTSTFNEFDSLIGLSFLKLFHMNDSKKELNSHVDRHENIGEGEIGIHAFSMIMNDKRFEEIPKLLETPKDEIFESDRKNMNALINLII
jgi:deoxyribonuclease-4